MAAPYGARAGRFRASAAQPVGKYGNRPLTEEEKRYNYIIDVARTTGSPEFAAYVTGLGLRGMRDAEREDCTAVVVELMDLHGTGADWNRAWPIDVYLEHGADLDTDWQDNPPAPVPLNVADATRINWLAALATFRQAVPPPSPRILLQFAALYLVARDQLAGAFGIKTDPPVRPAMMPNDVYITGVQDFLNRLRANYDTWTNEIIRLQADFPAAPTPTITATRTAAVTAYNAANGTPFQRSNGNAACGDWLTQLQAAVLALRPACPWFQAQCRYIRDYLNRYQRCRTPWNTVPILNFVRGVGAYLPMCRAIERHIKTILRRDCRAEVRLRWILFIQQGDDIVIRKDRYRQFHNMNSLAESGGWPYLPTSADESRVRWDNFVAALPVNDPTNSQLANFTALRATADGLIDRGILVDPPVWPNGVTPVAYQATLRLAVDRKDIPSVAGAWDMHGGKINELQPPLLAQANWRNSMELAVTFGNNRACDPLNWSRKDMWETMAATNVDPTLPPDVLRNTAARVQDLNARVFDFSNRFGKLIRCDPPPPVLTAVYVDTLALRVQTEMQAHAEGIWTNYRTWVFVNRTDADNVTLANLAANRAILIGRGLDYPPHEDPPPLTTLGAAAEALGFDGIRSGVGGNQNWRWRGSLGQGGFGHAGLWTTYDNLGRISDRKVIKETYLRPESWNRTAYWVGAMSRRVVQEDEISRYLDSLPGSTNIVRSEGYAIYESKFMYRVYMEYCAHGDLDQLIERYQALNAEGRLNAAGNPIVYSIPERQIWAIFDALVRALCLLQHGSIAQGFQALHIPIYHEDIKPANVFLAEPPAAGQPWQGIPTSKLGDFGLAGRINNPQTLLAGGGTTGYAPREQERYDPVEEAAFYARAGVVANSDVWAIGKVIWSLMELRIDDRPHRYDSPLSLIHMPFTAAGNRYSDDLRILVRACILDDAANRPDAADLRQRLEVRLVLGATNKRTDAPPAGEFVDIRPDPNALWAF